MEKKVYHDFLEDVLVFFYRLFDVSVFLIIKQSLPYSIFLSLIRFRLFSNCDFQVRKLEADILPLQESNAELSEKSGMLQAEKKLLEEDVKRWKTRTQVGNAHFYEVFWKRKKRKKVQSIF